MRKVLFIDDKPIFGGGQRVLVDYVSHLIEWNPIVVRPMDAREPPDAYPRSPEYLRFPDYPTGLSGRWSQIRSFPGIARTALGLRKIIRKHQPDLIVINTLYALIPLLLLRKAHTTKLVYVCHSTALPENSSVVRLISQCDLLIGVSQDVLGRLTEIPIPKEVLYNAIAPHRLSHGKSDIRDRLGWGDRWTLCYTGRLSEEKNLPALLTAMSIFNRERDEREEQAHLIVVGDGDEEQKLKTMVDKLGLHEQVYFHGYDDNALDILATTDGACLTSLNEGCPLAVLEAFALSLPTLVTPANGTRDLVTPGITAVVSDGFDPESIAVGLSALSQHRPGDDMSKQANQVYQTRFSYDQQRRNLQQIMKDLCNS